MRARCSEVQLSMVNKELLLQFHFSSSSCLCLMTLDEGTLFRGPVVYGGWGAFAPIASCLCCSSSCLCFQWLFASERLWMRVSLSFSSCLCCLRVVIWLNCVCFNSHCNVLNQLLCIINIHSIPSFALLIEKLSRLIYLTSHLFFKISLNEFLFFSLTLFQLKVQKDLSMDH